MKYWLIIAVAVTLVSCDTEGSKPDTSKVEIVENNAPKVVVDSNGVDFEADREIIDEKTIEGGVKIKWYEHGEGEKVKAGDMVNIDYKVYLENGKIIDGNHLINVESLPFMVGFQMQTESWDNALKELRAGDFAEVLIPASEMRGDKEIEGVVPKNANNI
ncbi:MAG: FKBP-type peptidyl-prolyl cis-trans isomerase, partial [Crocinitomicaceae bacterium]